MTAYKSLPVNDVVAANSFCRISPDDSGPQFSLAERAHVFQPLFRLFSFNTLWRWAELTPPQLARLAAERRAWVWRGDRALLIAEDTVDDDTPPGAPSLFINFAGAGRDDLVEFLRDARALAFSIGRPSARIAASVKDEVLTDALTTAGFERAWEDSLCLYEVRQ